MNGVSLVTQKEQEPTWVEQETGCFSKKNVVVISGAVAMVLGCQFVPLPVATAIGGLWLGLSVQIYRPPEELLKIQAEVAKIHKDSQQREAMIAAKKDRLKAAVRGMQNADSDFL